MVTEFLLLGSPDARDLNFLYFTVFPITYLGTLLGNLLIIIVTTADQNLHSPMYFFHRNLSILDMCFISITVLSACVNSLTLNWVISVNGCATQIFLVSLCIGRDLILSVMAWDCNVTICQRLQYPLIMNPQICSNVVPQFFCDVPYLLRLSCSDTTSNKVHILVPSVDIYGGCFLFIAMSYISIFSAVLKFPTRAPGKALSTCTPHILVVSVFLSSCTGVYLRSSATSDTLQILNLSAFYTMVPPFLNPLIYSLRNKQVKEAVRRVMGRELFSGKL
ncbi:olfactory receptor 14C36-like [Callospermophilus lateralis]